MAYKQLSPLNFNVRAQAGACLIQAQNVVGAGGGPHSATAAANATKHRHTGGKLPRDAAVAVWFSHWGTYWNYKLGRDTTEDYGHVVIWSPWAFDGRGGFYSSPAWGTGGLWLETIAEVERTFNCKYRFWSEDLNGVRICAPLAAPQPKPAAKPQSKPKPIPAPIPVEDEMHTTYMRDTKDKNGTIWMINSAGKRRALRKAEWENLKEQRRSMGMEIPPVADVSADELAKYPKA